MNDAPPKAEPGLKPTPESGGEDSPILFLHGIDRHYHQGGVTLEILKGAELAVWPGSKKTSPA